MTEEKRIYTVATAHLDTVWRWDLPETVKEYLPETAGKNFELFEQAPDYVFNFEGAFRYKLIDEYYPDIFKKIQQYAKVGKWRPAGSAWENGDVNIPSPEALFRNITAGNNYFEKKFGVRCNEMFLPDCFGFGGALPGIISHANLKGFITQKLGVGCCVGVPFDIGRWKGTNESTVFACTDPGSYSGTFENVRNDGNVVRKLESNEKIGSLPWTVSFYGDGDKGGAPNTGSVRAVSSCVKSNGSHRVKVLGSGIDDVFSDLSSLDENERERLPLFEGELLMTSHGAGCYTSRTMSNVLNRQNEIIADMAERACCAAISGNHPYPQSQLNCAWSRVIEHQFHDDITGTSAMSVYNRSWNDYFKSLSQFKTEYCAAVGAVARRLDSSFVRDIALVVNNPVAHQRTGIVDATVKMRENSPYVQVFDDKGNEVLTQICSKKGKTFHILFSADVPSMGYRVYEVRSSGAKCAIKSDLKITQHTLENSKYAVVLNKNGDIASIIDKRLKKQILSAPIKLEILKCNGEMEYPAWEMRYDEISAQPVAYANTPEFEIIENGSARITLKVTRTAASSLFTQEISLTANGEYIEVRNDVDWQSRRSLLKAVFPMSAHNHAAVYDLGLGVAKRQTNSESLYEVPAQKWADLSHFNNSFGVSIFSDSRCGWDKPDGNTLRLSCIHTPAGAYTKEARQDLQDIGKNLFSFAVYSHGGDFSDGTQIQSEFFANPMCAFQPEEKSGGDLGTCAGFCEISDSILIRAVKKAENSDEIIVRVNEANGKKISGAVLSVGFDGGIARAREIYGDESEKCASSVKNGKLVFDIEKFGVKTFALKLKKPKVKPDNVVCTPLSLPFNEYSVTDNMNRQLNILAASGMSLPEELFPNTINCGGIEFKLAPSDGKNAYIPKGESVKIPRGTAKIYFLCGGIRGDSMLEMTVGNMPRHIYVPDCFEPIGQWDMYALNQKAKIKPNVRLAYEFTHTHSPQDDNYCESADFFMCEIDVHGETELAFSENRGVVILAAAAVKCGGAPRAASDFPHYESSYDSYLSSGIIEKITDNLDFATIKAGEIRHLFKNKKSFKSNVVANMKKAFKSDK